MDWHGPIKPEEREGLLQAWQGLKATVEALPPVGQYTVASVAYRRWACACSPALPCCTTLPDIPAGCTVCSPDSLMQWVMLLHVQFWYRTLITIQACAIQAVESSVLVQHDRLLHAIEKLEEKR